MEMNTKVQYGLEALIYMASHKDIKYFSIHRIATNRNISDKYLEQIFALLKKTGILQSVRGKYGGYSFLIHPEKITVKMIYTSLSGSLEPVKCIETLQCPRESVCKTRPIWINMYMHIQDTLEGITLQSLADEYNRRRTCSYQHEYDTD